MTDPVVPDDAKDFLLRMIDSVAQWEGLLFLRAHPDTRWDAATISRHLYIGEEETIQLLRQLAERGLLSADHDGYRYSPSSKRLGRLVDQCADLYRLYLIPVTQIIHSKPSRAQAFADAFRLRKDK